MNLNERYKEIVRSVQMTESEKSAMRATLLWHMRSNSTPIKSPFYTIGWVRSSLAFIFVLILSGSGVAFASRDALPGDFAYPVKIQIEEIKGITKTTPSQKLVYSKKRAENRLAEIKVMLAKQDDIKPENIAIASKGLENHIQEARDNAAIIAESSNDADQKEALIAVKKLEENIEKDVKVLTALADEKNVDQNSLSALVSKKKDSVTEAVREIALPKKSETDELDNAILNISVDLDDMPAGTGEIRETGETTPLEN